MRYSAKLKAETARRLKQLLNDTGIQKKELAEIAGRSPALVSGMLKGTAPMTEKTAKKINAKYPDYSVKYLVGESPYRNEREREIEEQAKKKHDGDMLELGFSAIASACGYTLNARVVHVPQGEPLKSGMQEYVPEIEMIVSRDDETISISREDVRRIQYEVRDFLDFKIQQACKQGRENNN